MKKQSKKYFIKNINNEKYYTTNKELADMRDKYIDYDNLQGAPILLFLSSFIFIIIPACYIEENKIFPWWCWLLAAIGLSIIIGSIIFGCILSKKLDKYSKYEDIFFKSKEYSKQYNRYRKLEKEKKEKQLKEKATDLVESYNILEDKHLTKQMKIDLLKSYIERGEKRNGIK